MMGHMRSNDRKNKEQWLQLAVNAPHLSHNCSTCNNLFFLVWISDRVCRRPSWTPKTKPNGLFSMAGWFRFWCSTRLVRSVKKCLSYEWKPCKQWCRRWRAPKARINTTPVNEWRRLEAARFALTSSKGAKLRQQALRARSIKHHRGQKWAPPQALTNDEGNLILCVVQF